MKTGMIVSALLWLGLASILSGCSGIGLGGKLDLYRIDDRVESQNTKTTHRPLKCLFVPCSEGYSNEK